MKRGRNGDVTYALFMLQLIILPTVLQHIGAANYGLGPAFTYASLPPALQNAAAAAAASTGLPLSHYATAQSQLQEARMQ